MAATSLSAERENQEVFRGSAPVRHHLGQQALESYLWGAANLLRGLIDAGAELGAEQLPGRERASNGYVAGLLLPTRTPSDGSGNADEDNDLNTVPEWRPHGRRLVRERLWPPNSRDA